LYFTVRWVAVVMQEGVVSWLRRLEPASIPGQSMVRCEMDKLTSGIVFFYPSSRFSPVIILPPMLRIRIHSSTTDAVYSPLFTTLLKKTLFSFVLKGRRHSTRVA
jgi:hypothetical protein